MKIYMITAVLTFSFFNNAKADDGMKTFTEQCSKYGYENEACRESKSCAHDKAMGLCQFEGLECRLKDEADDFNYSVIKRFGPFSRYKGVCNSRAEVVGYKSKTANSSIQLTNLEGKVFEGTVTDLSISDFVEEVVSDKSGNCMVRFFSDGLGVYLFGADEKKRFRSLDESRDLLYRNLKRNESSNEVHFSMSSGHFFAIAKSNFGMSVDTKTNNPIEYHYMSQEGPFKQGIANINFRCANLREVLPTK